MRAGGKKKKRKILYQHYQNTLSCPQQTFVYFPLKKRKSAGWMNRLGLYFLQKKKNLGIQTSSKMPHSLRNKTVFLKGYINTFLIFCLLYKCGPLLSNTRTHPHTHTQPHTFTTSRPCSIVLGEELLSCVISCHRAVLTEA